MGYSFRLTAMVLLYAPSHRQDSTYHSHCYTNHGALVWNSSMGRPWRIDPTTHHTMSECSYHGATSRSIYVCVHSPWYIVFDAMCHIILFFSGKQTMSQNVLFFIVDKTVKLIIKLPMATSYIFLKLTFQYCYQIKILSNVHVYLNENYKYKGAKFSLGVINPNQIPLTTIVTFQTIGPLYLHAVWYLPFTNSPRKHTVTYHFSDLQEVYSGSPQIDTKCQLQYLQDINKWQMSLCNNSSNNKNYWIHRVDVKVSAQVTTVTYMHQSQPLFTPYIFDGAPRTLTWQSLDLVQCHL